MLQGSIGTYLVTVFKDIAHQFKGYLETFQTNKPMIPFLADAL